jgi:electron transport complex protein RnfG
MKHIVKPALSLFIVAALAAVSLGVVYDVMAEPIAENQRRARERMLREILPEAYEFDELEANVETADGRVQVVRLFEGRSERGTVGYVAEMVTGAGYGGSISLMVGFLREENRLAGVRVLRHSETPGFGAVISRESFFRRFDGLALVPLTVVNRAASPDEFQTITSSTVTTRAVVGAVNEAIDWYNRTRGDR